MDVNRFEEYLTKYQFHFSVTKMGEQLTKSVQKGPFGMIRKNNVTGLLWRHTAKIQHFSYLSSHAIFMALEITQ